MKRILSLVCAALLLLMLAGGGEEKQDFKPTERFFVNDYANVIDDSAEDEIYNMGAALDEATTAQVIVVTVKNISGKVISDFAVELGRDWGVGTKEDDNGVVILLCTDIREIYVATGYGLEGALPDSKTGRLIDLYALESFEANDFSNGLRALYSAVVNEVYVEYGMTPEGYTPINQIPQTDESDGEALKVAISWLILIVLVALYLGIFGRRHRSFYIGGPPMGGFGGGFYGGFRGGSGGFGGFGGGSGGFGGFRGGGGSFGGGGAGRKF